MRHWLGRPTRTDALERVGRELAAAVEAGRPPAAPSRLLRDALAAADNQPTRRPGDPEMGRRTPTYTYVRNYKAKAARRRTTARVVEALALAALVVAAAALAVDAPRIVFWLALAALVLAGVALVVLLRPRATRRRQ